MLTMVSQIPQLSSCQVLHAIAFCLTETKHGWLFLQKKAIQNQKTFRTNRLAPGSSSTANFLANPANFYITLSDLA